MQNGLDLTASAVKRQLAAMGAADFNIGVLGKLKRDPNEVGMLERSRSAEQICSAPHLGWLRSENARGAEIYVRPNRSNPSTLVLLDDLDQAGVDNLVERGLEPCVVTETSRANFQAWVRLSVNAVVPAVRTAVARQLAAELGADPNSADSAHFGRLAGFTNRKPERLVDGRSPFVLCRLAKPNAVARRGAELMAQGLATVQLQHAAAEEVRKAVAAAGTALQTLSTAVRPIADVGAWFETLNVQLRAKFGAAFNESKADWMLAGELFDRGYGYDLVEAVVLEHSVSLAAGKRHVVEYIQLTVGRAEAWSQLKRQGARWETAKSQLTQMTKMLSDQRAAARSSSSTEIPHTASAGWRQPREKGKEASMVQRPSP